ncbi:MAG: alpha/beta hydrolase [Pseudomonadota bacterium]
MLKRLGPVRSLLLLVALGGLAYWSYNDFRVGPPQQHIDYTREAPPTPDSDRASRMKEAHPQDQAFRSADDVWIHYDDQGDGEQTLVLVHGWNCDRSYWQLQRDFLAERFRVVTVDLAGHGESGVDRVDWSIDAFADDVAAVVIGLNLRRVTLVGHSMGGNVVLATADKLGSRLERVVAVDTLRRPDESFPATTLSATLDNMDIDYAGTVSAIVQTMFVDDSSRQVRDFVVRDMASSPPEVGRGALLALAAHNPMPQLQALTVPLVLINSSYQPTKVNILEATVDDFSYVEMTDVGHFVMLEDPTTFTDLLLAAVGG